MLQLKIALAQETLETKEMIVIYRRYTKKQASPEEMKIANKQFFDVLKERNPLLFFHKKHHLVMLQSLQYTD